MYGRTQLFFRHCACLWTRLSGETGLTKNGERPFRNSWQMNHPAQTNSVQPYCHLLKKYRFWNGHNKPLLLMQPSHVYKLVLTALDNLRCSPHLGLESRAFWSPGLLLRRLTGRQRKKSEEQEGNERQFYTWEGRASLGRRFSGFARSSFC
jgi:hypothetical protein